MVFRETPTRSASFSALNPKPFLAILTFSAKLVTLKITLIKNHPLRSNPMGAIFVSQEVTDESMDARYAYK